MTEVPQFGEPVAEVGPVRLYLNQAYWEAVVEHAKANHGQWIPLLNPPFELHRLQEIAQGLRTMKAKGTTRKVPPSLRVPGFRAQVAREVFLFRYDKPEES